MPYGRLDVFYPDGRFVTYPLSDTNISIGRSSGNQIALESNNISRYHFSLTYGDGQAAITDLDSANGTYVDGVKLPPNDAQALYGGEEIQIGDLRLLYCYLDDTPTRPMLVPEETRRVEVEAPAFRVEVREPPGAISPGAHISAEVTITSSVRARYTIDVAGVPREWVRIDRPDVEVDANKSETVVVKFTPTRRSESKPGDYPVSVVVRPKGETVTFLRAEVRLRVLPYTGFGLALDSRRLADDNRFRVRLHNHGSSILRLDISGRDREDGAALQFTFSQTHITLQPGQRLIIDGQALPGKRAHLGDAHEVAFDIRLQSQDASRFLVAERAYAQLTPAVPRWTLFASLGIGAALLALGIVVGIALLSRTIAPAAPTVRLVPLASSQVNQGELVDLAWESSSADRYVVWVAGTPVYDGTTPQTTISTSELAGDVLIAVAAVRGDERAEAQTTLRVVRPLRVDLFTVTPNTLVRHVVTTVTVEWHVPGAARTQVSGLELFTTTPALPVDGPSGVIGNVAGIAENPLTLTLYAEDNDGNAVEQTLTLDLIEPECRPSGADAVPLHAAPDPAAVIIGSVPADAVAIVNAQDASTQWLRIPVSGGMAGWGAQTAFTCADTFAVENLRKALDVPTAVPTTPPQTATPGAATAQDGLSASPAVPSATPPVTGSQRLVTATPRP